MADQKGRIAENDGIIAKQDDTISKGEQDLNSINQDVLKAQESLKTTNEKIKAGKTKIEQQKDESKELGVKILSKKQVLELKEPPRTFDGQHYKVPIAEDNNVKATAGQVNGASGNVICQPCCRLRLKRLGWQPVRLSHYPLHVNPFINHIKKVIEPDYL